MPGFLGGIGGVDFNNRFSYNKNLLLINNHISDSNFYIERRTIPKFENDKVFENTETYVIVTEGVILNSRQLINKYQKDNLSDTIKEMYSRNGDEFFNEFRGSFSGLLYDKNKDKWLIYTNFIGDKQVFYSKMKGGIIFGSEISYLVDYMKNSNIEYKLNRNAAYFLLTYGYMLEDYTLIDEIKKLEAGHYIKIENNDLEIKQYHKFDNTPFEDRSKDEIIEKIDGLFRNAIKLEYEKDKEYGYKHVAALSGGLDSRMNVWVAHEMGYTKMLNYTFSQSNYLDETIAKQISDDLKHEFIFKALDNGTFIMEVLEDAVKINSGMAHCSGLVHSRSLINLLNLKEYGLIHSGQLGDVIIGTYSTSENNEVYNFQAGATSTKLMNKIYNFKFKKPFKNEELFKMQNRGFLGILSGNTIAQEISEVISPFCNKEFLEYCFTVPYKYRSNHKIYFNWIKSKYPKAAKYKWENSGARITDIHLKIGKYYTSLNQLPNKAFNKIVRGGSRFSKNHMNPFDFWYKSNHKLKESMDRYFNDNIFRLDNYKELRMDCDFLYKSGNTVEKNQVLTLLAFMKLFFYK